MLTFVLVACATTKEQPVSMPSKYHLAVYIPETAEIHSEAHEEYLDAVLDVWVQAERLRIRIDDDTHVFVLMQKKFPDGSGQSLGDFFGPYIRALAESRVEADENFSKNKKHTER